MKHMTMFRVAAVKVVCEVLAFRIGSRSTSGVIWHMYIAVYRAKQEEEQPLPKQKQKLYMYRIIIKHQLSLVGKHLLQYLAIRVRMFA